MKIDISWGLSARPELMVPRDRWTWGRRHPFAGTFWEGLVKRWFELALGRKHLQVLKR